MGRGGGTGRGGSSFHGGGSSRTHYGGGRGGRGSASFGHSTGRPSGGSSHRPSGHAPFPAPRYHRRSYGPVYGRSSMGCGSLFACVIVFILLIAIVGYLHGFDSVSDGQITASTVERTRLPASECKTIDNWFEDNMSPAWVFSDRDLIKGLQTFYDKTGVQPYLVLMPDIDGDVYPTQTEIENKLKDIYDDVMPDGGHIVVGFLEGVPNEYGMGVYAGAQAEIVMDAEAREILMDYLDYYYTSDLDTEEYFATAFEKTAEKIMKIDEIKSVTRSRTIGTVVLVVGVALIIIVTARMVVRAKKYKAEQAKADAEILKSDLPGVSDTDPLKDKYGV